MSAILFSKNSAPLYTYFSDDSFIVFPIMLLIFQTQSSRRINGIGMCRVEHGLFVTGNHCHALLTSWHRLNCLHCSVKRETYLWGNRNHLSMAYLQVVFLMSVRNNNSVTQRSCLVFFCHRCSTWVSNNISFFRNFFFLFYIFAGLSPRNSTCTWKNTVLFSVNFKAPAVDFNWYWNWFKNWATSVALVSPSHLI